jgi:predicted TPR repeat methyltransferase
MGALDPFRITDKLEDPLLDVMVSRLEVRGKHWFFRKVLREYLDAMDADSAGTVLDMGCGTGVAARTASIKTVEPASGIRSARKRLSHLGA